MTGKLIVIESGTDGSGKATQTARLFQKLKKEGYQIHQVEYPNYGSDSSALVKMYLRGDFGQDPAQVNSFAASTFYAVDRFASYEREWKKYYQAGYLILADRYTTSNMVHQGAKFDDEKAKEEYLAWLWDLEFEKFKLPVPDLVIFLDMPPAQSVDLLKNRGNRLADIHERDEFYLSQTYRHACCLADKLGWKKVSCLREGRLKSIEEIHQEIYEIVLPILKEGEG